MLPSKKSKRVPKNETKAESAADRVCTLIESNFRGSRRALAEAAGVSHTAIIKVSNGQQPGRRLMESLIKNLNLNPAWLLTGAGAPFAETQKQPGIPISKKILPGAPKDFSDLLSGDCVEDSATLFTQSQYWLVLDQDQPILRDKERGFRCGDMLLMETDRAKFPRKSHFDNLLCVARFNKNGKEEYKLGVVEHYEASINNGDERFEIDCFEQDDDSAPVMFEHVYRHLPNGHVTHKKRMFRQQDNSGAFQEFRTSPLDLTPDLPRIHHSHIVSVWLQHLRRPWNVLL